MATIQVKGPEVTGKMILWEVNSEHPEGECWVVADGKTYTVGKTARVKVLLGTGALVEVEGSKPSAPEKKPIPNGLPWEEYDKQTEDDILAKLEEVDDETRAKVLAFEKAKGARGNKAIIKRIVNWNT